MGFLDKIFNNHGLKVHHISDTHGHHDMLEIPDDVDVLVHSGDHSNYRDIARNSVEVMNSIKWLSKQKAKHKIAIAGNHDTSIEAGMFKKDIFEEHGITYLENEEVIIDGIKFYGSPATPIFGDLAFMYDEDILQATWNMIPPDTDVLITHGPPKGILDTVDQRGYEEHPGCPNLLKRIEEIKPKYHMFGHIHNNGNIINAAVLFKKHTAFSNGSVVTDHEFGKVSSHGNTFHIKRS